MYYSEHKAPPPTLICRGNHSDKMKCQDLPQCTSGALSANAVVDVSQLLQDEVMR
jgi:hypothetical protein